MDGFRLWRIEASGRQPITGPIVAHRPILQGLGQGRSAGLLHWVAAAGPTGSWGLQHAYGSGSRKGRLAIIDHRLTPSRVHTLAGKGIKDSTIVEPETWQSPTSTLECVSALFRPSLSRPQPHPRALNVWMPV